jgi:hypothetical protein
MKATVDPSLEIAVAWIWLKSPYVRHFWSEVEYTPTAQRTFHLLAASFATGNPQDTTPPPGPRLATARGRLAVPGGRLSDSEWSGDINLRLASVVRFRNRDCKRRQCEEPHDVTFGQHLNLRLIPRSAWLRSAVSHPGRPMRCTRFWKRGSERRGSKAGRTRIEGLKCWS